MTRKVVIHYSAWSNITYNGTIDYLTLEDGEEYTEEELQDMAVEWLFGDVDVYAEVVDED